MDKIEAFLKNKQPFQEGGRAAYLNPDIFFCTVAFREHPFWSSITSIVGISRNHKVNWYFFAENDASFDYALKRILGDKGFSDRTEQEVLNIVDRAKKELGAVAYEAVTDEELLFAYQNYVASYRNLAALPAFLRLIDRAVVRQLRLAFPPEKIDEVLAIAGHPNKLSYGRRESIAILESAIAVSKQQADLAKEAKRLQAQFGTSTLGYFNEQEKTEDHYIAKIEEEIKASPEERLKKIIDEEEQAQVAMKDLKKDLSDSMKTIIGIASSAVFLKDHYKFYVNKLQALGEPIFHEIAKRKNLDVSLVKDLTEEEVAKLLQGETIDMDAVRKRIEFHVIVTTDTSENILVGEQAAAFEKKFLAHDASQSEFKGRIACKGKSSGKAKIVLSPADFKKMNQGDILVVMNTSPDFVPIMKRAGAIVAEEGGITGHVSVVSREFGIPCVVGIAKITDIIKDNDDIDVDAEQGIVKIRR
jgi:phosphohistidine swiveling domain-containing protein